MRTESSFGGDKSVSNHSLSDRQAAKRAPSSEEWQERAADSVRFGCPGLFRASAAIAPAGSERSAAPTASAADKKEIHLSLAPRLIISTLN